MFVIACCFCFLLQQGSAQPSDKEICNKIFSFAFEHKLYQKPIGDVIVAVGERFMGTPYEAHTLDRSGTERLVVNLHSVDCVTFVENVLALARCIKGNRLSYQAFEDELRMIRYRVGIVNGYASRLHYFADWIADNERKNIVTNVTGKLGGVVPGKTINFMTSHRDAYPKMVDDSTFAFIKGVEDSLSQHKILYLPKKHLHEVESKIANGDIIAITTSVNGLDVSHTGIAVRSKDGNLHLLHAPDVKGTVTLTKETLRQHLENTTSQTGIIVTRPLETKDN
jgi:hypothetical protein